MCSAQRLFFRHAPEHRRALSWILTRELNSSRCIFRLRREEQHSSWNSDPICLKQHVSDRIRVTGETVACKCARSQHEGGSDDKLNYDLAKLTDVDLEMSNQQSTYAWDSTVTAHPRYRYRYASFIVSNKSGSAHASNSTAVPEAQGSPSSSLRHGSKVDNGPPDFLVPEGPDKEPPTRYTRAHTPTSVSPLCDVLSAYRGARTDDRETHFIIPHTHHGGNNIGMGERAYHVRQRALIFLEYRQT